jgi:hypothetical protein
MTDTAALATTRDLASRWIAAVAKGGLASEAAVALTTADFKLNLPRSLSPYLGVPGLDTPRSALAGVEAAARKLFDPGAVKVGRKVYDIFQGDRGGVQYAIRLQPRRGGAPLDTVVSLTFARANDALAAVWVHLDTSDLKLTLDA